MTFEELVTTVLPIPVKGGYRLSALGFKPKLPAGEIVARFTVREEFTVPLEHVEDVHDIADPEAS